MEFFEMKNNRNSPKSKKKEKMSNFIPYENYRKIVETLMDANAENMLLESKVTKLQTNLDFQKETTELYHAKYQAYFYENRRLQRQIKQLKAKDDRTSANMNTTTIDPIGDESTIMDSPDWRAPALSKQVAEDSVSSEEANEVISDAMPIDDSSSGDEDEDEPEVIPRVQPSIPEVFPGTLPQSITEGESDELILALPSTIPSVIAGPDSETSPPNDLLALPSSSNVMAITGPPTKLSGRLGNTRQFSSPFAPIPAKRHAKRFICRKESCERTNCIFNSLEGYRNHIKSAHPTLKFLCSWCPYATAYKRNWNNHELIHIDNDLTYDGKSALKSAICQLCNVKFSSGTTLGYNNGQLQKHNKMFH